MSQKWQIPLFLLTYIVEVAALATVAHFNVPWPLLKPNLLSHQKHSFKSETELFHHLIKIARSPQERSNCYIPFLLTSEVEDEKTYRILQKSDAEINFGTSLFEVESPTLSPELCFYTGHIDQLKSEIHVSNVKERIRKIISSFPNSDSLGSIVLSLTIENKDGPDRHLLGSLNGLTGPFILISDTTPLAFWTDRSQAPNSIPITVRSRSSTTLRFVTTRLGQTQIGLNVAKHFVGIKQTIENLSTPPTAIERNSTRTAGLVLTLSISFILTVIALFSKRSLTLLAISAGLLGVTVVEALQLEFVQGNLDSYWIRLFRSVGIIGQALALGHILSGLGEKTLSRLLGIQFQKLKQSIVVITTIYPIASSVLLIWGRSELLFIRQYQSISPLYALSTVLGVFVILVSMYIIIGSRNLTEESDSNSIRSHGYEECSEAIMVVTYSLIAGQLTSWLESKHIPLFGSFLSQQAIPIIVLFGLLLLIGRTMWIYRVIERIIPPSALQMIKAQNILEELHDSTASTKNWLIKNDIVGSTEMMLQNLGITMHLLRSQLHKIHRVYFEDRMHFVHSEGDALLVALRNGTDPIAKDPVIDKLVRSYLLYRDGSIWLQDHLETVISLLKFENKELNDHIELKFLMRRSGTNDRIRLRSMLSQDYFHFGYNHDVANIDSRELFITAKSEKYLPRTEEGGFFIFPSLANSLALGFPEFSTFFTPLELQINSAPNSIRNSLPKHVWRLNDDYSSWENHLESIVGSKIPFIRNFEFCRRSICELTNSVASTLKKCKSGSELASSLERNIGAATGFAEKNLLIRAACDRSVELAIWDTAEHAKIRRSLELLGTPNQEMIKKIHDRDESLDPERLVNGLSHWNAQVRTYSALKLPLARVQSKQRPGCLPEDVVAKNVWKIYLKESHRIGVDGHLSICELTFNREAYRTAFLDASLLSSNFENWREALARRPESTLRVISRKYDELLRTLDRHGNTAA